MKLIFCCFLIFSVSCAQAQQWEELTPIPADGRDDAAAFVIGGYAYLVTGNQSGFSQSSRLWKYDPPNDSWSEAAAFPGTPRQYAATFVLGNEAYLFCGISEASVPLNDVWKYVPATDSWHQLNDFPGQPRWSLFSSETGGKGYLGTGTTLSAFLNDCWEYDPQQDTWSQLADFPGGARREAVAFSANGKLFAGLGYVNFNGTGLQSDFYAFDPSANSWEQIADFPGGALSYATATGTGAFGYVGTGFDASGAFRSDSYRFNASGLSWEQLASLPVSGIKGMSAFMIGSEPYFVTGLVPGIGRTSQLWKFPMPEPDPDVLCFPNPSTGTVVIRALPDSEIRLYTLRGEMAHALRPVGLYTLFTELLPGTYLVQIERSGVLSCEILIVY